MYTDNQLVMYAKQNPMICSTTGTCGTCGTSFEEHVVLVVHVVLLWEHQELQEQQLKQHTDIASHVIQPQSYAKQHPQL
jgi:hypothetical protein